MSIFDRFKNKNKYLLGHKIGTKKAVFSDEDPACGHILFIGDRGSGIDVAPLGILTKMISASSGGIIIDGDNDPSLFFRVRNIFEALGRSDNLVLCSSEQPLPDDFFAVNQNKVIYLHCKSTSDLLTELGYDSLISNERLIIDAWLAHNKANDNLFVAMLNCNKLEPDLIQQKFEEQVFAGKNVIFSLNTFIFDKVALEPGNASCYSPTLLNRNNFDQAYIGQVKNNMLLDSLISSFDVEAGDKFKQSISDFQAGEFYHWWSGDLMKLRVPFPQAIFSIKKKPDAINDVISERQRQITKEGWTTEHDDAHNDRVLAMAAQCYVGHYVGRSWLVTQSDDKESGLLEYQSEEVPNNWPEHWDDASWKPKNPRSDLVRAAALIIAEIERIDRLEK